jgi:hypothetical protein
MGTQDANTTHFNSSVSFADDTKEIALVDPNRPALSLSHFFVVLRPVVYPMLLLPNLVTMDGVELM